MTLIPFLEKLIENLPKRYPHIIADAGYESEEFKQEAEDLKKLTDSYKEEE